MFASSERACDQWQSSRKFTPLIVAIINHVETLKAGPVVIDPALADAILYAGYGGEEAGNGVADVIFGVVSPSYGARFRQKSTLEDAIGSHACSLYCSL
jgi:hypothetical protein